MKILPQFYNNLDLTIVDQFFAIGDDGYPISELNAACSKYNLPDHVKQTMLDSYAFNIRSSENWDLLVNHENQQVRVLVVLNKRPQDIDSLINDESYRVRRAVAQYGRPQDLDILVRDPHWIVRVEVAKRGRPKDLKVLLNDENNQVVTTAYKLFKGALK